MGAEDLLRRRNFAEMVSASLASLLLRSLLKKIKKDKEK